MLRTVLAMFVIGGTAAWGQGRAEKADRATAYYHYMLAHMYTEMAAATKGCNHEYADKAVKNYKAAIKADPQLSDMKRLTPLVLPFHRHLTTR